MFEQTTKSVTKKQTKGDMRFFLGEDNPGLGLHKKSFHLFRLDILIIIVPTILNRFMFQFTSSSLHANIPQSTYTPIFLK